jgi:serine protease inhibitor
MASIPTPHPKRRWATRHRSRTLTTVAALVTVGLLGGCAAAPPPMTTLSLKRSKVAFAQIGVDRTREDIGALVDLATTTGAAVASSRRTDADATVVSPWSLLQLLLTLRAGSGGDATTQLDALGLSGAKDPLRAMAALTGQVQQWAGDPGRLDSGSVPASPLLQTAPAVLATDSLALRGEFLDRLGKYLNTGVYPVRTSGFDAALGQWAAVNTGEQLESVPLRAPSDTDIEFAGTVFLAAGWRLPFDPRRTRTATFFAPGAPMDAQLMRATVPARSARGDGFTTLQLDYGTSLALQVLLPDPGGDPGTLLARKPLTEARLALAAAPVAAHDVTLPRWRVSGWSDPVPALRALGLGAPFTAGDGLSGISGSRPTVTGARLGTALTVAERGSTSGAAGTAGTAAAGDGADTVGTGEASTTPPTPAAPADAPPGPDPFTVDRPFAYAVVDTATGLPLLIGTVLRPS